MHKNRSVLKFSILAALALALAPVASHAGQDPAPAGRRVVTLAGRHALTVRVGTLTLSVRSTVAPDGIRSGTSTDVLAELSYAHWLREDWSIGVSGGALVVGAEAGTSAAGFASSTAADGVQAGATFRSSAVTSVLFNVGYQPARLVFAGSARPYFSLGVGPYVGTAEKNVRLGTDVVVESVSNTELGFRALAGVDWHLGRHFKVGLSGGYHFVGRFDEPIGSYRDHSGPEFSFGFGILIGAGR